MINYRAILLTKRQQREEEKKEKAEIRMANRDKELDKHKLNFGHDCNDYRIDV